jgi:hypothetical protein
VSAVLVNQVTDDKLHKTFDERFPNFVLKLASLLQSAKVHIEILKPVCKQKTYNFPY